MNQSFCVATDQFFSLLQSAIGQGMTRKDHSEVSNQVYIIIKDLHRYSANGSQELNLEFHLFGF